jgi:hypothetical protein
MREYVGLRPSNSGGTIVTPRLDCSEEQQA